MKALAALAVVSALVACAAAVFTAHRAQCPAEPFAPKKAQIIV